MTVTHIEGICDECVPALAKIVEGFYRLRHQGTELKKRRTGYPEPKRQGTGHYQNIVAQNEWLRNNIFDAMRDYLFCHDSVQKALHVSQQRLSRQRKIKRRLFQQQQVKMTKVVEEKNLLLLL